MEDILKIKNVIQGNDDELQSKAIKKLLTKKSITTEMMIFCLSYLPSENLIRTIIAQELTENLKLFILKRLLGLERSTIICLTPISKRDLEVLIMAGCFHEKTARKIEIMELNEYVSNKIFPIFYKGRVMGDW